MGETATGNERLPWLEAATSPAATPRAARTARTPLLILLGLFVASAIAVMAFLAGRSTAPRAALAETRSPPPTRVATPAPVATPVTAPAKPQPLAPRPLEASPPPVVVAPIRAAPTEQGAARPKPRSEVAPRQARPPEVRKITRKVGRKVVDVADVDPIPARVRTARHAFSPQRRVTWSAQPFAGPRGRVIQLGAYITPAQADAAWWRLARAYPYLGTLPRVVTVIGPTPGRPRYHRLRLAAGSRREARALCNNLRRIGRGCMIV